MFVVIFFAFCVKISSYEYVLSGYVPMDNYVVLALYKFVTLDVFQTLKEPLLTIMTKHGIRGTLLLAKEGINGTVAGRREAIDALYAWFKTQPYFDNLMCKESFCEEMPFNRTKVKLKKEIVTLGEEGIDPARHAGTYVKPKDWNQFISRDDVIVVDTRNDYEVQIGAFKGAMNPNTQTFREFPQFVEEHLTSQKDKKIAMYCTGGIRCEKSTAYLKKMGFEDVYHLEGGILQYLEDVPEHDSLWEGECFVFDERVAVNHALEKGQYDQCHACRFPITAQDKQHRDYVHGISCPHCVETRSDSQTKRYTEREKQNQLAKQRGEVHIGGDVADVIYTRRILKKERRYHQKVMQG
jgi:UPF0176 protein